MAETNYQYITKTPAKQPSLAGVLYFNGRWNSNTNGLWKAVR
jgi:hypothetical protein